MAKSSSSNTPRMQFIFLGVLLLLLIIWGSRQCTSSTAMSEEEMLEARLQARMDSMTTLLNRANNNTSPIAEQGRPVATDTVRRRRNPTVREQVTPLYITIDNLAMRQGPGLQYEIIDRLPLYDEVNFLHQVTDSLYTIKLGSITTTEPWVKIRNRKGRDGWVYGAGVDFYKRKLEGVE